LYEGMRGHKAYCLSLVTPTSASEILARHQLEGGAPLFFADWLDQALTRLLAQFVGQALEQFFTFIPVQLAPEDAVLNPFQSKVEARLGYAVADPVVLDVVHHEFPRCRSCETSRSSTRALISSRASRSKRPF